MGFMNLVLRAYAILSSPTPSLLVLAEKGNGRHLPTRQSSLRVFLHDFSHGQTWSFVSQLTDPNLRINKGVSLYHSFLSVCSQQIENYGPKRNKSAQCLRLVSMAE